MTYLPLESFVPSLERTLELVSQPDSLRNIDILRQAGSAALFRR